MASWHQQRNPGGLAALWQPHPTNWKIVSDKFNEFASSISFEDEGQARLYVVRNGGHLIPPLSANPDRKD